MSKKGVGAQGKLIVVDEVQEESRPVHELVRVEHPDGEFQCTSCFGVMNWIDGFQKECPGPPQPTPRREMTLEQESFELTIFTSPDDMITRGVYADWLDEHGDPDFASGLRTIPSWLVTNNKYLNPLKDYLPKDLRLRCIMWSVMGDMFPDFEEKEYRVLWGIASPGHLAMVTEALRKLAEAK